MEIAALRLGLFGKIIHFDLSMKPLHKLRGKPMFDFARQNAIAVRNFALFSGIFRLGKQAKYSFCRPHNLRSLVNQQIVVEPTAVSFQMETQTGTEFAGQKKSE